MSPSISRRSRFSSSSWRASSSGALEAVGREALDADRHVGQAARGVDAWADRKAEIARARALRASRPATWNSAAMPGCRPAGADALQSLRHQHAVVVVEPHDVGDRAERDEVEQRIEPWLRRRVEAAARAQFGAQRQQHVEHHADAGQVLAREAAAAAGSD